MIRDRLISTTQIAEQIMLEPVSVAIVFESKFTIGTTAFALSVAVDQLEEDAGHYSSMTRKLTLKNGSTVHFVTADRLNTLRGLNLHGAVFATVDAAAAPLVVEFISSRVRSGDMGVRFLGN